MEKILSVNHILHLTRARSMALAMAATSYTTLAPPPQLQRPLTVANFKNERATAMTRINMRPPNSIRMRGAGGLEYYQ
ncbi:hypothetical protein COP2_039944 [Malus domestica]